MAIEYRITLDDEHEFSYRIELERQYDPYAAAQTPRWTRLENNRCSNCPLNPAQYSHCPAAVDLHRVIEDFRGLPAFKKVSVQVRTPEREYIKHAGLEEGLRALLGVIMATSACPLLGRLKPMAQQHLPFASNQEFILRAVSLYLMRQYFNFRRPARRLGAEGAGEAVPAVATGESGVLAANPRDLRGRLEPEGFPQFLLHGIEHELFAGGATAEGAAAADERGHARRLKPGGPRRARCLT